MVYTLILQQLYTSRPSMIIPISFETAKLSSTIHMSSQFRIREYSNSFLLIQRACNGYNKTHTLFTPCQFESYSNTCTPPLILVSQSISVSPTVNMVSLFAFPFLVLIRLSEQEFFPIPHISPKLLIYSLLDFTRTERPEDTSVLDTVVLVRIFSPY